MATELHRYVTKFEGKNKGEKEMTKKNIIALIISILVIFVGAIITWQTSDTEVSCLGLIMSFLGVAVALMISDGKES